MKAVYEDNVSKLTRRKLIALMKRDAAFCRLVVTSDSRVKFVDSKIISLSSL